MAKQTSQLSWCIVRMGEDGNWWVDEVSDPIHWDTDGLSILDPRQIAHMVELCEPLREYGLDLDYLDDAFFTFRIDKEVKDGYIRLVRYRDSLLMSEEKLFGVPDILNEDKGPYAELLDQLIKARVKLLNDSLDLEQPLTTDELEESLQERANSEYNDGRALHIFVELCAILEYVPAGYEDELDEARATTPGAAAKSKVIDEIPDIEEEALEADETMKWGDEDEDKEDEEEDGDEDEEEDEDDEEDRPARKAVKPAPRPAPKIPKKPAKPAPKATSKKPTQKKKK